MGIEALVLDQPAAVFEAEEASALARQAITHEYQLSDGTLVHAESVQDAINKGCKYLMELAMESPDEADALFELGTKPILADELPADRSAQNTRQDAPVKNQKKTDIAPHLPLRDTKINDGKSSHQAENQPRGIVPEQVTVTASAPDHRSAMLLNRDEMLSSQNLAAASDAAERKMPFATKGQSRLKTLADERDYARISEEGATSKRTDAKPQPSKKARSTGKVTAMKVSDKRRPVGRSKRFVKPAGQSAKVQQVAARRVTDVTVSKVASVVELPVRTPRDSAAHEFAERPVGPVVPSFPETVAEMVDSAVQEFVAEDFGMPDELFVEQFAEQEPGEAAEAIVGLESTGEATALIDEETMDAYRELLRIQLEDLFTQDTIEKEPSARDPILTPEVIAENERHEHIEIEDYGLDHTRQLESIFTVELDEEAPQTFAALHERANEQTLEQTLLQLSVLLPEADLGSIEESELHASEIVTAIFEAAEAFDMLLQNSHESGLLTITPELTEKLVEMLRVIGYQNPGEELVKFVRKYELQVLIDAIFRLRMILAAGDYRRQVQSTQTPPQNDDTTIRRLGSHLGKFITIAVHPAAAAA